MQPAHLIEKIAFMRTHQLETVSSAIHQRLRMRLTDCISIIRPPTSMLSMLAIDLAYITHRHWRWADTETFGEIYIDYLCSEYAIERGFAEIAHLEACQMALSEESHSESPSMRDEIFLRYLLISTAAHRDPLALAEEMGFGEKFFRKLMTCIDEWERVQKDPDQWNFSDIFSSKIRKQISEMAKSEREFSEQLPAELVRYRVYEFNREITTLPTFAYGRMVIDILTNISLGDRTTTQPWADASNDSDSSQIHSNDLALMNGGWDSLVRSQLLFQVGQRRRSGARPFALTDYSEWLLALSGGRAWLEKNAVTIDALVALPKYMQTEVIRLLPKKNVPMLVQLMTERVNTCQPAALAAAVERIGRFTTPDRVSALTQCSLKLCASPWSRAALCRALAGMHTANVGQILKEVADSDESLAVRDAALGALLTMAQTDVS